MNKANQFLAMVKIVNLTLLLFISMMLISKIARLFGNLNEFGGNQIMSPGWKHTQPSARISLLNF